MAVDLLRAALPSAPQPQLAAAARRPFIADHAVQALAAGRAQPGAAGAAMAAWFRRTRRLGSRDRRVVSDLAFGVVRHEALLRLAAGPPDAGSDNTPDSDLALVQAYARVLDGDPLAEVPSQGPAADFATALSLPRPLTDPWLDELGVDQAAAFAAAQAERAPTTLRVNLAWGSRDAAAALLAEDGVETTPVGRWGLDLVGRANLHVTRAFKQGAVEVQDLSSQRLVEALHDVRPLEGLRVLDLCAGAGGKSLALAALGASVGAWDPRPSALAALADRARRARVDIHIASPQPGWDVVLVDAPCSGSGRLRREPTLRWGLDPQQPVSADLLALQERLLAQAATLVRPDGLLAYATCSLDRREAAPPLPGPWSPIASHRHWPHRGAGDGFSHLFLTASGSPPTSTRL